MGTAGVERAWRPGFPVDLDSTLSALRRSSYDPTFHREPCGAIWRTARTPDGPGTVRFKPNRLDGTILIHSWGPGALWLLDAGPDWLGRRDDPDSFLPVYPVLRELFGLDPESEPEPESFAFAAVLSAPSLPDFSSSRLRRFVP